MKERSGGINIQVLNIVLIAATAVVFSLTLAISGTVGRRFGDVRAALDKFFVCQRSAETIRGSADFLTEQARLFVVTRKAGYAEAYLGEFDGGRLAGAMEDLERVCSREDVALQRLKVALEQEQSLINMELYSIRLAYKSEGDRDIPGLVREIPLRRQDENLSPEELRQAAVWNIINEGYLIYKKRIEGNCILAISAIEEQIKAELDMNSDELGMNIARLRILFLILLVVNAILFTSFTALVISPLKKFRDAIRRDEKLRVTGSLECRLLAESYNEMHEQKEQKERSLLRKAEYDALTGILNRRAFDQICADSGETRRPIALLLIDMDNFKRINDTYGHAGGDAALKALASLLTETFRADDYVARIGGDEFAALLPGVHRGCAHAVKEKIARVNERLSELDGIRDVSVSVGAAFSPDGFSGELFNRADKALYVTKERGKRGCEIYEENFDA